jgi:predicted dehydrogenase
MLGAVVVGTGTGCITHVRALRKAGFDVTALVGRDPARTADRATRFGVETAMTSFTDALALPGADVVAVTTPPHTHAALVLEAIGAGKHVVCEKPFARDTGEAITMLEAAEAAGIVHLMGTEWRWGTLQALAARSIAQGAIGTPRLATLLLHLPMLARPDAEVPDWWAEADQGGGWLGGHAAHFIDEVRVTLGEFEGVSAAFPRVSEHNWTAEDSYSVRFRLTSGVEGIMQGTAVDRGPYLSLVRISGTKGTLWFEGDAVWVADDDGARQLPVPDDLVVSPPDPPPGEALVTAYEKMRVGGGDMGPYTRLYETFRDLIDGQPMPTDPRPATFADGVALMTVMDAIRRSANDGHWVTVASR